MRIQDSTVFLGWLDFEKSNDPRNADPPWQIGKNAIKALQNLPNKESISATLCIRGDHTYGVIRFSKDEIAHFHPNSDPITE